MMSPKAANFLRALDTLCREHGVTIAASYEPIELWGFDGEAIYGGEGMAKDRTESASKAEP